MIQSRPKSAKRITWSRVFLLPVLMLVFLFAGCATEEEPEIQYVTVELPEGSTKLYYLNEERTKVVSENFDLSFGSVDEGWYDLGRRYRSIGE
jgi:hypothetical protein